jgi:phage repressor protein C with HTH and peptisase S24 domain
MSELKVHARACDIEPMVQIEEIRAAFVSRLKKSLAAHGIDQWGAGARLAEIAKVTPKASSKWLNGESMPGPAKMQSIADALQVKVEWLQHGAGEGPALSHMADTAQKSAEASASDLVRDMLARQGKALSEAARTRLLAAAEEADSPVELEQSYLPSTYSNLRPRKEEILIPQYDVRGAMGHGQVPADYNEAVRNLVVREELLREKGVSYTSPTALAMITGWGQSMEGTINDKDLVIVDRGINEFIGEGIYVVTWHQELYIKRIQRMDEDHYRLISDNQHYENQTARIDDVAIHAKVLFIWNGRKA